MSHGLRFVRPDQVFPSFLDPVALLNMLRANNAKVIPESLVIREFAKQDCTELHVVQTMHQRKQMMAERADAFLALPGGIGTFEELFEVWTWRQLGYHDKPIGLLNVDGYYDAMQAFMGQTVQAGFVSDWQTSCFVHVTVNVSITQ